MIPSVIKEACTKCKSFRELSLHLHELFMMCELLHNDHPVFKTERKTKTEVGRAKTENIAKWLRLASQIDTVQLDTFKYEVASYYCEPVADYLDSNANHFSSIVTPLTRFIFVANALEETYRFSSRAYELKYELDRAIDPHLERKRDYSMQAAWLLERTLLDAEAPLLYEHKLDNLRRLALRYKANFTVRFNSELESIGGVSYGLSIVRDIRNQIAHAEFPIIDDPNYTFQFSQPDNQHLIIRLLQLASRVAAINIQMLLRITNDGFSSEGYHYLCDDSEYGDKMKSLCTTEYLGNLHLEQDFGLNDLAQSRLHQHWDESNDDN